MKQPPDESNRPRVEVPGYDLLEKVGHGGMGVVYKARHRLMNRLVALKLIRGDVLGNPDAVRRFLREIQAVARLSHPHVVLAHDAGRVGDGLYLVMEFVAGTDLHRLVRDKGRLPVARACECVRQAALGLQHAWERGLVHRDVKPSNLLLGRSGVVKVSDFGLVCLRAAAPLGTPLSSLTTDNAYLGTPDFMAPEQMLDPRSTDCRADLYSLGCTLYYLLTGRVPFPGGGMEKVAAHLSREAEPVERLRPEVPGAVCDVVRRLLAKQPAERYQTPAELAAALTPFTGVAADPAVSTVSLPKDVGSTLRDRPTERKPARPRRTAWIVAGVLALAGVLTAAAVWRGLSPPATTEEKPSNPGPHAKAPPAEAEPEARAALRAQGAALFPDRPGEPVTEIRLDGPRITDDTLKHLRAFPFLEKLAFNHEVTRVTAAGLAHLEGLTYLRSLDLGNLDWVTDEGLRHLRGLKNLETLLLHNTHVGDDGLAHLQNLYRLNTLYLYNTRVTDRGLAYLHGLRNMSYLNLKGLRLSDRAVRELRQALPAARIETD